MRMGSTTFILNGSMMVFINWVSAPVNVERQAAFQQATSVSEYDGLFVLGVFAQRTKPAGGLADRTPILLTGCSLGIALDGLYHPLRGEVGSMLPDSAGVFTRLPAPEKNEPRRPFGDDPT